MIRSFVLAGLVTSAIGVAHPFAAVAQDAAVQADVVKSGRTLKDNTGKSVGKIDRVNSDGSVRLIFGEKFVTIPADKVTVTNGAPASLLSKREIASLD